MFKSRIKYYSAVLSALIAFAFFAPEAVADNVDTSKSTGTKQYSTKSGKSSRQGRKTIVKQTVEDFDDSLKKMREAYFQSQFASALVYCENAIQNMPKNIEQSRKISVLMICMELSDRNDKYENSLAIASKIYALGPDPKVHDSVCFNEATTLTKLHRWSDARQRYSDCPGKTEQEMAVVESNVAELWMIEGDSEAAAKEYKKSLEHFPNNPHAQYGLAIALSRLRQWDDARKVFLSGLAIDPGFSFLKDAFFEPLHENDYQTAFRLFELGRYRDARFYLERYIKAEERTEYRKIAQELLDKINQNTGTHVGTYPVLAGNIRSIASTQNSQKIVFASLERESSDKYKTVVWVLNTATEKVTRRAEFPSQIITDMAFVDESRLRLLGSRNRYEMNIDDPESGYYIYPNNPDAFALMLGQNGSEIHAIAADGTLTTAPWNNPWDVAALTEIPLTTKRFRLTPDHQSMVLITTLKTQHIDIARQETRELLPAQFEVASAAAHPSKKKFALGIQSGAIIVDENGEIENIYGSVGNADNLAFDISGKYLAVQSGQTLELWDIAE